MTNALEAENLTKRFGKLTALDSLDLEAPSGQVVAVLGPNGSGKTTFVRSVSTVLRPDAGSLRVYGVDARKNPNQVRRMMVNAVRGLVLGPAAESLLAQPAQLLRNSIPGLVAGADSPVRPHSHSPLQASLTR